MNLFCTPTWFNEFRPHRWRVIGFDPGTPTFVHIRCRGCGHTFAAEVHG